MKKILRTKIVYFLCICSERKLVFVFSFAILLMLYSERYRGSKGYDKKWTVLAYINLFIMHLKSKLRKRRRSVNSSESAYPLSENYPIMPKQNNWVTPEERLAQNSSVPRNNSIVPSTVSMRTTIGEGVQTVVSRVKSIFKKKRVSSVGIEASTLGQTSSTVADSSIPIEVRTTSGKLR